jgi:hypothetical protein
MRCGIIPATYVPIHLVVTVTRLRSVAERAAVVVVMIGVAVMPVPVMRPTAVRVPPSRPVTPVPRTIPCVPSIAPKPVVYNRPINVNGFYDVVLSVHILVADYLNRYFVLLIFLHVYRGYILVDILCQYRLQNDQTLVSFAGLYHA